MTTAAETSMFLETALPNERAWLVHLCGKMAGDYRAAEDLAQETLYEAWRNRYKLVDPTGLQPWLSAIARNVCLRWRSGHDQVTSPFIRPNPDDWADDDCDLVLELERQDFIDLLDRARWCCSSGDTAHAVAAVTSERARVIVSVLRPTGAPGYMTGNISETVTLHIEPRTQIWLDDAGGVAEHEGGWWLEQICCRQSPFRTRRHAWVSAINSSRAD